jgi:uncharacterized protein
LAKSILNLPVTFPGKKRSDPMEKISISVENVSLEAEMFDTPTAAKILEALPFESAANVWGDEIYFDIALRLDPEPDARAEVRVGDLAYWPAGPAFCIFFGPAAGLQPGECFWKGPGRCIAV